MHTNTLIIFDLVSTLTDAGPRYVRALKEVMARRHLPAPRDSDILDMLGDKNLSEITDHFLGPLSASDKTSFMNECNNTCDALLDRPDWHEGPFPRVRETLENLLARGITLGVFTGTRENAMKAQLEYHEIDTLFDGRYMRGKDNERDSGKTNSALKTEQIASIVNQFASDIQGAPRVVIVGDSESDARAAGNLNLEFIGFTVREQSRERLIRAGVTKVLGDFSQLTEVVDAGFFPVVTAKKNDRRGGNNFRPKV
jgi:phosphoglycolate phosphatase-like HAD superfamily hydrolase